MKMEKGLLFDTLLEIALQTDTVLTIDKDIYALTMVNGSDSVKLVYANTVNGGWWIEIFPIDQNKGIQEIQFSNQNDAIKAFQVFTAYYQLVVTENFKMF